MQILEEPERGMRNARQIMMMHKKAHGTGQNPEIPTIDEIEETMQGLSNETYIDIYGDGSYTTPAKWWCALGGTGCWIPDWRKGNQQQTGRGEQSIAASLYGQTGSSTRMELAAWITALSQPIRSCYATDSASMLGKALHLLKKQKKPWKTRPVRRFVTGLNSCRQNYQRKTALD